MEHDRQIWAFPNCLKPLSPYQQSPSLLLLS
jgi:hypothetical protein